MTRRDDLDPYGVLGVRRQASPDQIARAYRRAARLTHPDGGGSGAASDKIKAMEAAGITVCASPAQIGEKIAERLQKS